jgi:hypothetical protein
VLVQLPPNFHADFDRLAATLEAFPDGVRVAVEPREIMQEGDAGLRITWADGRVCQYTAPALRRACPCATTSGSAYRGGMEQFVQLTVNGLADGAILALAALGFVLIYKASGVINFAQGFFLAVGAYVLWTGMVEFGLHWTLAVLMALAVAVVLGLSVERLVLRPLVGQPTIAVIMVTIGLAQILAALIQLVWGTEPRTFPDFIPSGAVEVLGARVSEDRLWALGLTALLSGGILPRRPLLDPFPDA